MNDTQTESELKNMPFLEDIIGDEGSSQKEAQSTINESPESPNIDSELKIAETETELTQGVAQEENDDKTDSDLKIEDDNKNMTVSDRNTTVEVIGTADKKKITFL